MPPRFDSQSLDRLRELLRDRPAAVIETTQHRPAAVLIPLIHDERLGWSLIFSRRAENLTAHSGQIAFPGGALEAGETLIAAAVRETHEEVGIPPVAIEVIGRLDDMITNSGYLVSPVVAVIHERVEYVMQQSEVVEVFEVPLSALLAPHNPEIRYVPFRNRRFPAYFYRYDSYEIWGLTGRIVKSFIDIVWQSL